MNRRQALVLAGAALLARPARAQGKVRRVGNLTLTDVGGSQAFARVWRAFEERMREQGYVEGLNLAIERRHAGGMVSQLPLAAAELSRLKVEVIVTVGAQNVRAMQRAAPTMPVVALLGDPVGSGLVKSLARPGGMVTGVTNIGADLAVKQLELLRATVPGLKRIAVLGNSSNPFTKSIVGSLQAGAGRMGLSVELFDASLEGVEGAFANLARRKPGAVVVVQDVLFVREGKRIADLLLEHRLPSACGSTEQAELGLLMSYGAHVVEAYRRMASYVDRILRGAKPGELPMEILEHYELVLNMKTARALGIVIPREVLARADRVIE